MLRSKIICVLFTVLLISGLLSGCTEKQTESVPTEETEKAKLMYEDVPADQLIYIGLYRPDDGSFPGMEMWDIAEPIQKKYGLERVYNAPSLFAGSTGKTLSDEEVWKLMEAIAEEDQVVTVRREYTAYPDQKIDKYVTGPAPLPLGECEDPWIEHASLEEAEAAVGFTFTIPELDLEKVYRTYEQSVLEVIFVRDGAELYRLRKGRGYGNISGDETRKLTGSFGIGGPVSKGFCPETQSGGPWPHENPPEGTEGSITIAARLYRSFSYSLTSEEWLTEEQVVSFFVDDKNQTWKP